LKIVFWSNVNERCGVTANLAAISVASVIRYPYSIITMENRLRHHNLGRAYMGNSQPGQLQEVGSNYYDGNGIEGLMRKIYRGDYHSDTLKLYLNEIIQDHLYYIPQGRVIHNEVFDYEFDRCIQTLFSLIEEKADICIVEATSHSSLSTKIILDEADLIVVNLCQNQIILEDFFLNYSSLIHKAIFIISGYRTNSRLNCRRIASEYNIQLENIIPIPDNEMYQCAFQNGSVVEYVYRNYFLTKDHPNYIFIQSIKKAAYVMIKKAELLTKLKEMPMCGR
jgi:hypothetical protein